MKKHCFLYHDPSSFGEYVFCFLYCLGKHCQEWPAGKNQVKKERKKKKKDLIAYTDGSVAKDQSEWGFTVKHGVTIIHADGAASDMVSTFCLTTDVEAVNSNGWAASRGDSQTTSVIILTVNELATKSEKKNGKPRMACVNVEDTKWRILWCFGVVLWSVAFPFSFSSSNVWVLVYV